MISEPDEGKDRRGLSAALLLSLVLHLGLLPLFMWLFGTPFVSAAKSAQQETVSETEAITISRRARPIHRELLTPHPRPPQPRTMPQPQRHIQQPRKQQQPPPRELARLRPNAPPQPPRSRKPSFAQQLAAQSQQFAREAQRLHEENNPLAIAQSTPNPASLRRSYREMSTQTSHEGFLSLLTSTRQWYDGDYSCHYATYHTMFGGGGMEDGSIPWPICYPRSHDPMLLGARELPVPVPPFGWHLPAGTYLTPFLRGIYNERPGPTS